ncbi:trypsin-like isoform X2 [Leptopilina boulardi]|uniref:trypsin-like isoform X2 n=1 Tax=Leptopilina boulardi TaxID=63433 RepID=UPI0021F54D18|nr:trypsin-like isoform X2 [Leptopilina boulardi]
MINLYFITVRRVLNFTKVMIFLITFIFFINSSIIICDAHYDYLVKRIIGGKVADINHIPYMAAIFHDENYRCGAVIIDKLWLITASHCVQELQSDYTVRLGTSYKYYGGEEHKIDKVIRYREKYSKRDDAGYNDDIALIKLDIPIEIKEKQSPILLAKFDDLPVGRKIQISGFGVTSENGLASNVLRTAFVPIIDEDECKKIYSNNPLNDDRVFCAGFVKTGGVDSCFGDSGGPAVLNGKLIGIVMGGDGCARPGYPELIRGILQVGVYIW